MAVKFLLILIIIGFKRYDGNISLNFVRKIVTHSVVHNIILQTYASFKISFSLYFLGYVPDFSDVDSNVMLSCCSMDVDKVDVPLLELYL